MSKIFVFAAIVSTSLVAAAVPSQARQFSVWGNTFTTEDAPAVLPGTSATGEFRATVENPEQYSRHHTRSRRSTR